MLDIVAATIARHHMLAPGERVMAAVSGGPDSVCLLHVLRELAPAFGFTLAGVAHCNHQLRGEESEEDARFAGALAKEFGLPFYVATSPPDPGNLEQSARRARRAFFQKLIHEGRGTRVALGHTRDDQAETVLFRLLRGSGLTGLAGILPVTAEGLIRPMLEVGREEVRAYLVSSGIVWREDASNRDPRFARNRIRAGLLPQLARDWNPNIATALAQLADLAYEEERWWAAEIASRYPQADANEFPADELAKMPPAVARRLVRRAIRAAKGDLRGIAYQHVEAVLELARRAEGGGRIALPGVPVQRSFAWLRFGPLPRAVPAQAISAPGAYPSPDAKSLIEINLGEPAGEVPACDTLKAELGWSKWPVGLELRGWKAGDRYCPLGSAREHKLTELFQQARVPSWRRPSWPIITKDGRIVWVRQFGAAAQFAANRESGLRVCIVESANRWGAS